MKRIKICIACKELGRGYTVSNCFTQNLYLNYANLFSWHVVAFPWATSVDSCLKYNQHKWNVTYSEYSNMLYYIYRFWVTNWYHLPFFFTKMLQRSYNFGASSKGIFVVANFFPSNYESLWDESLVQKYNFVVWHWITVFKVGIKKTCELQENDEIKNSTVMQFEKKCRLLLRWKIYRRSYAYSSKTRISFTFCSRISK